MFYIIIFVFLLWIFVITYLIMWDFMYQCRDEIYITKLVWWGNIFIYWPFVFQWIIYAVLWFFISFVTCLLLLNNMSFIFDKDMIKNYVLDNNLNYLYLLQLLIFIIIWAISSLLSSNKYIRN